MMNILYCQFVAPISYAPVSCLLDMFSHGGARDLICIARDLMCLDFEIPKQ